MQRTRWMMFVVVMCGLSIGCGSAGTEPSDPQDDAGESVRDADDGSVRDADDASVRDADDASGDDGESDAGQDLSNGKDMGGTEDSATHLEDIFQAVFVDQGCTAGYCHGGAVDELLMRDHDTVMATVNQASEFGHCADTLIVPGDPESSELWYRIRPEGMHGGEDCEAPKMPKGAVVDEGTAQLVYDWIKDGAHR